MKRYFKYTAAAVSAVTMAVSAVPAMAAQVIVNDGTQKTAEATEEVKAEETKTEEVKTEETAQTPQGDPQCDPLQKPEMYHIYRAGT